MEDLLWIGPALIAGIIAARIGMPPKCSIFVNPQPTNKKAKPG